MRRNFYLMSALSAALMLDACSASTPDIQAAGVYQDFADVCRKYVECINRHHDEAACDHPDLSKIVLNGESAVTCPDEVIHAPKNMEMIAQRGSVQFTHTADGWRLTPGNRLDFELPHMALSQLRFAIKNRDVERFRAVTDASSLPENVEEWLDSAQANEIYAAIASTPDPWFIMDKKTATCEVAGILLVFKLDGGRWFWMRGQS